MKFRHIVPIALGLILGGCSSKDDKAKPTTNDTDNATKSAKAKPAETKPAPPPAKAMPPLPKDTGAHGGKLVHAAQFGGLAREAAVAAAADSSGNVFIGGNMRGKVTANKIELTPVGVDALVAKLDNKGAVVWARNFGGEGDDTIEGLDVGSDGSVVTVGAFNGKFTIGDKTIDSLGADDAFIAKFSSDGLRQWAKIIGGSNIDAAHQVAIDSNNNIVATGVFRDAIEFGGKRTLSEGDADIFLTKLDGDGKVTWFKSFGARAADYGRAIAFDSDDNIYFMCEFSHDVDLGGGPLSSQGNRDIAIAKFTPAGEHIWSFSFGNTSDLLGIDLAVDPANNVIFAGSYDLKLKLGNIEFKSVGQNDILIAKFDANGKQMWAKSFGDKQKDLGTAVATDKFGNVFAAGYFDRTVNFGGAELKTNGKRDGFFVKFDPAGAHLWSRGIGGPEPDFPRAILVGDDGTSTLVGTFYGKVDFGGTSLETKNKKKAHLPTSDVFVATYAR